MISMDLPVDLATGFGGVGVGIGARAAVLGTSGAEFDVSGAGGSEPSLIGPPECTSLTNYATFSCTILRPWLTIKFLIFSAGLPPDVTEICTSGSSS